MGSKWSPWFWLLRSNEKLADECMRIISSIPPCMLACNLLDCSVFRTCVSCPLYSFSVVNLTPPEYIDWVWSEGACECTLFKFDPKPKLLPFYGICFGLWTLEIGKLALSLCIASVTRFFTLKRTLPNFITSPCSTFTKSDSSLTFIDRSWIYSGFVNFIDFWFISLIINHA